ncbi:MAG: TRAP transporter fused permease subunit [Rhodospirillales bacterium]|jgi:TRAP transporter 4TM/12TM fusion protein|nr:C4-dicarboxylate ABC transporter permease [Rhodospirillaceae bacterium]MDP6841909.1 TRAP transporter fused permease subunit [Rhodospirillales bacterium]|tara:strand:- start:378 stop:2321 length:1944 start_codon:yes stop_codon:yes gene_type:complete
MPNENARADAVPSAPWYEKFAIPILGVVLCLIALSLSAEFHLLIIEDMFTEQGLAVILGIALGVVFLKFPFNRNQQRDKVPWYDALFALVGFASMIYLSFRYQHLQENEFYTRPEQFVIGIIVIPLIIESLRRTTGWSLVAILSAFLVYALFGDLVPGNLKGLSLLPIHQKAVPFLVLDNTAIFGVPMTIICTIVVMFIFMGQLLLKSGGSNWFTDIAMALMGHTRGGSAKIAVVASGLFGSISGTAVSNVASTGVITIPLMRQAGYSRKVAGAFEAVASTGGQIMPPIMGAAAFLMAEFLEISYAEVVVAAVIPALLYYIAVFFFADLEAAKNNIAPVPKDQIPNIFVVLKEGWFFTLPFAVLIYALFSLNKSPEESALWASGSIIIVNWVFGYKGRRMSLRDIYLAVRDTGINAVDIVIIGAMAGMIIGIVTVTGLGNGLTIVLVILGEGNLWLLLLLTALICIILGMGMPTTAIYLLVATLAAPPLIELGINPLAAHLFVLYFGIVSLITPPVAVAAFVAAKLADAGPMETAVTSVRIGWTALIIPVLFVISPDLIMQGRLVDVSLSFITAVAGVWLVTAALMGYAIRPIGPVLRSFFLLAGVALLIPSGAFEGWEFTNTAGAILAVLLVGREYMAKSRKLATR